MIFQFVGIGVHTVAETIMICEASGADVPPPESRV
jgi:hypothetical protein